MWTKSLTDYVLADPAGSIRPEDGDGETIETLAQALREYLASRAIVRAPA